MDESYISSIYKKDIKKANFLQSSIFRFSLITLLFLAYLFIFSPFVESFLKDSILEGIREGNRTTLNYLTPLYGQEIYTSEYTLDSLASSNTYTKVVSNTNIKTVDARVVAMQKFLFNYNSPMYLSAKTFITEADKYGLDWRLVASISGVESAFGNITPDYTNNAWGWRGINKNPQGWSQFESWDEGISVVTSGLAIGYGITLTPFQIESTYCPPCGLNPAHVWANGVSRFMRELTYYLENLN